MIPDVYRSCSLLHILITLKWEILDFLSLKMQPWSAQAKDSKVTKKEEKLQNKNKFNLGRSWLQMISFLLVYMHLFPVYFCI